MNETARRQEQRPDQQYVGREIQDAIFEDREVGDAAAALIASWHATEAAPALSRFAATGAIERHALLDEYLLIYAGQAHDPYELVTLDFLGTYWLNAPARDDQGNRGPVGDWDQLTQWSIQ
jgi:hypothetical protein